MRFRCEAKSDLPVRYRWLKDGKVLIDRRRGTGYSSYLLRLKKLKFSDVGNYTCIANNGLDSVSFSFSLHMIRKFVLSPKSLIFMMHPSVSLQ